MKEEIANFWRELEQEQRQIITYELNQKFKVKQLFETGNLNWRE